jgi:NAD(P)H-dependent flavin oxidoreductase YrpB (nitropropane dioxygenase family)
MTRSAARHGLLGKLGLRVPIIQAPMAGVSTPEIAAAVSSAGGLGARTAGESGYGAQWAGQGAPLCRTGAAAAILQALAAELDACRGEARIMG